MTKIDYDNIGTQLIKHEVVISFVYKGYRKIASLTIETNIWGIDLINSIVEQFMDDYGEDRETEFKDPKGNPYMLAFIAEEMKDLIVKVDIVSSTYVSDMSEQYKIIKKTTRN